MLIIFTSEMISQVCIYMCVCVCVCVKNDQTILYTTNMYNLLYVIISH